MKLIEEDYKPKEGDVVLAYCSGSGGGSRYIGIGIVNIDKLRGEYINYQQIFRAKVERPYCTGSWDNIAYGDCKHLFQFLLTEDEYLPSLVIPSL